MSDLPNPLSSEQDSFISSQVVSKSNVSVFKLLKMSLLLVGQNFALVYSVILYFIIASLAVPKINSASSTSNHVDWPWWLLLASLVGLWFVFQSGWHTNMRYVSRQWYFQKSPLPPDDPTAENFDPFRRTKQFFSDFVGGIGQYGVSFIVGGFIWLAITFVAPALLFNWVGETFVGVPATVFKLSQQNTLTQKDIEALLRHMSDAEWQQWTYWLGLMIATFLTWVFMQTLLLFWPQYVLLKTLNPLKAMWLSIQTTLNHPVGVILLSVGYSTLLFLFLFFTVLSPVTAFFAHILLIISIIQFGFILFMFLFQTDAQLAADSHN